MADGGLRMNYEGWERLGDPGSSVVAQLLELGFHCRVTSGQFFDGDVLCFVVGEAEVSVGAEEGVFGLLEREV